MRPSESFDIAALEESNRSRSANTPSADGTNLRELTTAACRPLFETPPVLHASGSEKPYRRCVDLEAGQPGE